MKASAAIRAGVFASLGWFIIIVCVWLFGAESTPRSGIAQLGSLVAMILPFALIWLAAVAADSLIELRAEASALRLVVDALRRDMASPASIRVAGDAGDSRTAAQKAAPQKTSGSIVAASDAPGGQVEITAKTLILSLNFPDGPDDHDAVEALHIALNDSELARLIRAAQDAITLLAGKGVYMDDLVTHLPLAEDWRDYVAGGRGRDLSALAGIGDEAAKEKVLRLLQQDEIIRDAIHHFLRQYDRILSREAPKLSDDQLVFLSDTRSGRAFMLLADVSGNFG